MSTTSAPARRRRGFGRPTDDAGPRARFSQLLPYLLEHKRVLAFVIVLSILGAAASLAQPLLVSQVIEVVGKQEPLGGLVWGLIALVVISGIISGYQHYLLQRTGEGVVLSSRRKLVGRLLRLPISEFDTRRTGDLVSRVGSDTTLLRAVLTQGLVEAIGGALTFIGALIAMLIIDPVLLGLTVLVVAVSIVVVVLLSGRIRVASQKAQNKVGDLAAAVERAISSVRTIRASNATEREIATVDEDATGAWRMGIRVAKISALVVPVAGIAMQVSFLVVLGVGGFRVASGAITVANLVAFILFLFMMILPLGQAFGAIAAVNSALGALGRIQEILDLPTEDQHDREIAPLALTVGAANEALAPEAPAIEFVDVRFAYPEGTAPEDTADGSRPASGGGRQQTPEQPTPERLAFEALTGADVVAEAEAAAGAGSDEGTHRHGGVLQGVSFRVPRGKRTALVGPSGAGKSTILALVERFYDPQAGEVRFGGMDVRTLDRVSLRSQIGYVEQDAPVLAGSLRDNLTLAAPDATDQECIDVLHAVNLTEVLERSELGLGAPVGEDGIMLSGGERQRLAIARALLAAPPVLLLDESTSSLDGRNEQLMREAIDAVAEDRTLLVIAHRLSTVVDSDQIVVLDHGRVIGSGTHSELVETTPLYRDLAKHQLLV
ncbi:ATP-binding cassette, subfamily B [Leifsonia sp. 98AMF]|uniref:ABC transporter ATP-binding protein n=1 Tax=unclassified Leifsonia TaxID=2663824 RepID=UPI00087C4B51|nr:MULTISPECIES: ABC transporter ATP-binding protein [unclassified Leifsonia]SDH16925.1 ATP-binding cassette, subfamily B [Leifsonia sp. 197AMF]SDJ21398.1 ATP-binding cassette, subfamily B [Leifsonia sp. 466MF]SDJ43568.1 ATP-binding cassette, subfamily B [Leifsonia sp. 157MF]SDN43045.1 ATP-binding cassette, subfamily B [Leifsonia sp. 509MF]SEM77300.1 ATP-binding cassette, subfamily B [Leifsonia sp. 467MF]